MTLGPSVDADRHAPIMRRPLFDGESAEFNRLERPALKTVAQNGLRPYPRLSRLCASTVRFAQLGDIPKNVIGTAD
ncbi:MAG TPA: hypothetical protein VIV11_40515, partial [Kofleriaceae bacterium]